MHFLYYSKWQNYIQQYRKLSTPNMDYVYNATCNARYVHRQAQRGEDERKAGGPDYKTNSKSAIQRQIISTSFLKVKLKNKH